jgi:hypothetical protein
LGHATKALCARKINSCVNDVVKDLKA